jgi:fructooligosaccharide transport system permease protein
MNLSLKTRESIAGYGFVLPALLLLIVFGFIPLILAGYISLFDFPLVNPANREYIGLENYVRSFQDENLRTAFFNTVYYAVLQIPLITSIGLLLALLIQKPIKGLFIFRTGFYLPVVISMVVASVLWRVMLDSQNGLINGILSTLHLPRQPFLTSPKMALPTLAFMLTWKWAGFSMLIFLAGLNNIPTELYESAQIDGANPFQRFRFITLPLLKRPALYIIVVNTINAFKLFTPVWVITRGGPQNSTLVMIYYIFRQAFQYRRLGYGAAISVLFMGFLMLLAITQIRIMRSEPD